jgi:peroxiredoxin Q/BCP
MIAPGERLDLDFKLQVLRDGVAREVTFADLLQRRTIVSVYMKNNTPSCDRQNESLAEHAATFDRAGYDLVAISRDTCGSHARYAMKKGIAYTLASDPEDRFARATDSLVEKSMYGKKYTGPARAAYVLERDGTVLAVVEKVDTADHAAQLRAVIKKL